MERERTGKDKNFVAKAKKFVEDKILDSDILANFLAGSIVGSISMILYYVEANKTRFRNNVVRLSESRREIAPLNPKIVKDMKDIASSIF